MHITTCREGLQSLPSCQSFSTDLIFPVPFFTLQWSNVSSLNKNLKELILHRQAIDKGIKISNVGGWHSKQDLLEWEGDSINQFRGMIMEAVKYILPEITDPVSEDFTPDWEIEAWANINVQGSSNKSHDHTRNGNQWSGVYYLESANIDGTEENGITVFEDRYYYNGHFVNRVPSIIKDGEPVKREFFVVPRDGVMVLFPGTLPHRVETYYGDKKRITIAFNLKHKSFGVYEYKKNEQATHSYKAKIKSWMWSNFRGIMIALKYLKGQVKS